MTLSLVYADAALGLRDYFRDMAADLGVTSSRINIGTSDGDESQIVIFRVAGGDDTSDAPVDHPQLQIDIWHGTSYNTCKNVKNKVRAALRELRSRNLNSTTRALGTAEVQSEIFLPDRETNALRFALTVDLTVTAI